MPFGTSRGQGFNNPVLQSFAAGNVRVNKNGLFVYAGTPASGNLIVSAAAFAGVDKFGNAFPAGLNTTILSLFAAIFTSGAVLESAGTGVQLLNGPLVSQGGNPANPTSISTDNPHSLGTIAGSNCAILEARYWLTPENEVLIDIALEALAGGSVAGSYTFTVTLPAQYTPPGAFLRVYPLAFNAPIATATQDSVLIVDCSAGPVPGRVRVTMPAVAASVFYTATQRIPLN
jgi:hypothetical protein